MQGITSGPRRPKIGHTVFRVIESRPESRTGSSPAVHIHLSRPITSRWRRPRGRPRTSPGPDFSGVHAPGLTSARRLHGVPSGGGWSSTDAPQAPHTDSWGSAWRSWHHRRGLSGLAPMEQLDSHPCTGPRARMAFIDFRAAGIRSWIDVILMYYRETCGASSTLRPGLRTPDST